MIENNKFEKSFGPVGSFAGLVLFFVGIFITYFHLTGIILILIGAVLGFSSTSTLIDFENKRIKFSNNIIGVIKIGKWLTIDSTMKIGVRESRLTWPGYSWGNRPIDIENNDYRIVLLNSDNFEIMPIKKFNTREVANEEIESIGNRLGLRLY